MVVNLAIQIPPETLVDKLRSGKSISKEQVIRESMRASYNMGYLSL